MYQEIDAWDHATARNRRIKSGGMYVFSVYIMRSGTVDGTFNILLEAYDNNTWRGYLPRRYRDSGTDQLAEYTGAAAKLALAASDLTTEWSRYYAVFRADPSLGVTKQIRVTLEYADGTASITDGIFITQAMLSEGEELSVWTPDMGSDVQHPVPADPPGGIGDSDGRRGGRYQEA
jgi:hypothetical protein